VEKTKACLVCGNLFEVNKRYPRKKFCCRKCNDKFKHTNKLTQYEYTCCTCGKTYHPKQKNRNKYCSRECCERKPALLIKCKQNPAVTNKIINNFIISYSNKVNICNECGKVFISKQNNHSDFCSLKCYFYYNNSKKHNESILECKECGAKFFNRYGDKRRVFCSDGCSKRFNRRIRKARKRVAKDNAIVNSFSLYQILIRDNYKCGICGEQIDVSLPSNHKMSATIDHVIPLSKDGSHCWNNVQAAHLSCNSKKGNRKTGNCYPLIRGHR